MSAAAATLARIAPPMIFRIATFDSAPSAPDDDELRRLAVRLHELGDRPLYELLREVLAGADLHERLKRYARLDPAITRYLGASEFPDKNSRPPASTGRPR